MIGSLRMHTNRTIRSKWFPHIHKIFSFTHSHYYGPAMWIFRLNWKNGISPDRECIDWIYSLMNFHVASMLKSFFFGHKKGTQIYSCCIFLLRFLRIKHQFRTLVDGWHSAFAKIITTKTHSTDILLIINKCRQFTIDCAPSFSFFSAHPIEHYLLYTLFSLLFWNRDTKWNKKRNEWKKKNRLFFCCGTGDFNMKS